MNADDKRQLENQLIVMGLPGLGDPALVQAMADIVNGYPIMAERVDFFCDMLNECEGARRREMYEAMRPRLSFDVPSLDACEARIAAKAERLIRPQHMPSTSRKTQDAEARVELTCGECGKKSVFGGQTTVDARGNARAAGWGRGADRFSFACAECRLIAMPVTIFGKSFTGGHGNEKVN